MSRGLADWDDETIELVRSRFIAVSLPTWVCRAEGAEGEFLRGAGIHERWVTSSGYQHCVSPSGRLLGGRPSAEVLAAFEALPEGERRPGAVPVPDLPPSEHVVPAPPEGGLVLRVHARFLARGGDGALRAAGTGDFPGMRADPGLAGLWRSFLEPNTEYLWLTGDEWHSLVPEEPAPVPGRRHAVDPAISMRLARFHLNPKRATTSEGGIVPRGAVRTARMELVIDEVSPTTVRMRLVGMVHWGSAFDADQATSPNGPLPLGFATPLHGRLEYDRAGEAFTRFDLVAPGEVWGRWGDANNQSLPVERPGRVPFGFALELATGDSPTDRLPPGGNSRTVTEPHGYFDGEP